MLQNSPLQCKESDMFGRGVNFKMLPLRDEPGWLKIYPDGNEYRVRKCDLCRKIKHEQEFPPRRSTGKIPGICRTCAKKFVYDPCWNKWHKHDLYSDDLYNYLHGLVRGARGGARSRKLYFRIEPIEVFDLYFAQNGKCALSGMELTYLKSNKHTQRRGGRRVLTNVSIDRIDNEKGYIPGNIHLVASVVNIMKGTMSIDDLIYVCGKIILTRADELDAEEKQISL